METDVGNQAQYLVAFLMGIAAVGGVGALFVWSWLRGQFRDVEAPGDRLLELEDETSVRR